MSEPTFSAAQLAQIREIVREELRALSARLTIGAVRGLQRSDVDMQQLVTPDAPERLHDQDRPVAHVDRLPSVEDDRRGE